MGNSHSDIKSTFSSKHIPEHLKPIKKKKHRQPRSVNYIVEEDENELKKQKALQKPGIMNIPAVVIDNVDEEDVAEGEASLVGSGPRGAFRWFKGRRYINHHEKVLDKNLLPNDQLELDRLRVLSFIIRWGFRSNIVAPIEEDLQKGIHVLNVGYGPGMWPGHYIIDMALDYRQSHFAAVDLCDLLPSDFEEDNSFKSSANSSSISCTKPTQTLFTPMHPKLSTKLQNTTTPVMDSSVDTTHSSEIHSQLLSSHIEDTATISTMSDIEDDHLETATRIGQLFINGSPPISRKLLQNLEFYEANVLNAKLPFEDNHFDFVQQRLVTSSFTISDWKCAIQELVRVTKPGGYIQLLEIDHYTFNLGPLGKLWEAELINTIREKREMEPRMARHLPDLLKAVGMVDVSSKLVSIPFGSWGLDLGVLWKNNMESFAESTAPLFSKLVGRTPAEYRQKWRTLLEEAKDRKAFSNIHAAWAKKPADYQQDAIDWSLCPPFCTDIK